jgi:hypothetical protein
MNLERISFHKADELKSELNNYESDNVVMLDGLTAVQSLALVAKAPRDFGPPIVVFDGPGRARQRIEQESQEILF